MKKAIVVFILFFFGIDVHSYAQSGSIIKTSVGKRHVKRFQSYRLHPSSFLIKSLSKGEGIGDYLLGASDNQKTYLHLYFGTKITPDGQGGEKKEKMMVITGAVQESDGQGGTRIVHDSRSKFWATPVSEPNCCVPFDQDIDYMDGGADNCDIANCTVGIIDTAMAKEYIKNFQRGNDNEVYWPKVFVTESFIMSANEIKNYLQYNRGIEYLQIYMGYKYQERYDNFTAMLIGTDNMGRHIWGRDVNDNQTMFDESDPCPTCLVQFDASMDYHHQDGTAMDRKKDKKVKK